MRISILSPAHNEGRHIEEMVRSVISQSHDDWELIIVNDRSTDDTVDRARSISDPRIVVIDDPEVHGKNSAFNRAWSVATGDLIAFFGADDVMPPEALSIRVGSLAGTDAAREPAASFAKIRSFSENRKYDGIVTPRGSRGNRSGGSTTLTRRLASLVFPIPEDLPNEDTWTQAVSALAAVRSVEVPEIVVHYRIHDGNSHRRGQSFSSMNEFLARRYRAYGLLLKDDRYQWSAEGRRWLEEQARLEELRRNRRTINLLLTRGVPPVRRLRLAAYSSPALHAVRQGAYRLFSGW